MSSSFSRVRTGHFPPLNGAMRDTFGRAEGAKWGTFRGPKVPNGIPSLGSLVAPIYRYLLTRTEAVSKVKNVGSHACARSQRPRLRLRHASPTHPESQLARSIVPWAT